MFLKRIAFFILLLNSGTFLHVSAMDMGVKAKPFVAATSAPMSSSSSASTSSSTSTKIDPNKPLTQDEAVDILKDLSNPDAAIGDEVIDYISKGNMAELGKINVLPTKSPSKSYTIEAFSYVDPNFNKANEVPVANGKSKADIAFQMISHMVNVWKIDPNTPLDSNNNTMVHKCTWYSKYATENVRPVYEALLENLKTLQGINVKAVNKFQQTPENVTKDNPKVAAADNKASSSKPSAETTDTTKLNAPKSSNIWKWLLGGGAVAIFIYLFNKFNSNDEDED